MTCCLTQDANGNPVLVTEPLRLRWPRMSDVGRSFAFWSSQHSALRGAPWMHEALQAETTGLPDQWHNHGLSLFTVSRLGLDDGSGGIGPFFPASHPEPELERRLLDASDEGQGLAFEAAAAFRDWCFATSGHATAVTYTDPENTLSHRLCARLGAVIDAAALHPYGEEPTLTFRHHPGGHA